MATGGEMPDDSISCKLGVMMGKLDSLIDTTAHNMAMVRVRIDNIDSSLASLKGSHTDIKVSVAELKTEQANLKAEQNRLDLEQDVLKKFAHENIGKEKMSENMRIIIFAVLTLALAATVDFHKIFFG